MCVQIYETLSKKSPDHENDLKLHLACCYYMLGLYEQAFRTAKADEGMLSTLFTIIIVGYFVEKVACLPHVLCNCTAIKRCSGRRIDFSKTLKSYTLLGVSDLKAHTEVLAF